MITKKNRGINCCRVVEQYLRDKIEKNDFTFSSPESKSNAVLVETLSVEEMYSFKQIYSSDKEEKYYSVRKDLPENYFISKYGTLIYLNGNNVYLKKSKINNAREEYTLNVMIGRKKYSLSLQPATLVNLTFGGKATDSAYLLLKDYGIIALKMLERKEIDKLADKEEYPNVSDKSKKLVLKCIEEPKNKYHLVELNHEYKYKKGLTINEIKKLRRENCDLNRVQFEYKFEHDAITYSPENIVPIERVCKLNSIPAQKKMKQMTRVISIGSLEDAPTVFSLHGDKSGTVYDNVNVDFNKKLITAKEQNFKINKVDSIMFGEKIILTDENYNKLEIYKDISQTCYEELCEKYKNFVKEYGVIIPINIGTYKEKGIIAMTESLIERTQKDVSK